MSIISNVDEDGLYMIYNNMLRHVRIFIDICREVITNFDCMCTSKSKIASNDSQL